MLFSQSVGTDKGNNSRAIRQGTLSTVVSPGWATRTAPELRFTAEFL